MMWRIEDEYYLEDLKDKFLYRSQMFVKWELIINYYI